MLLFAAVDGLGWVGDGPDVVGNGWDGLGWVRDGPDVVGNGWDPLGLDRLDRSGIP